MPGAADPPLHEPDDEFVVRLFNSEARHLWQTVIDKVLVLNECLGPGGDRTAAWPLIDECLTLMIRVTRIFWPVSDNRVSQRRGELMRSVVNAAKEPPAELRRVRNAVEHLDERIDRWLAAPSRHNIVSLTVAPIGSVKGADLARHFDDMTGIVYIFGEQIDFQTAVADVEVLIKRLPCLTCGEVHAGGHLSN